MLDTIRYMLRMLCFSPPVLAATLVAWVCLSFIQPWGKLAFAQDDDFLDDLPSQGLIGTLEDQHGNRCLRIDRGLTFSWDDNRPDPRLRGGALTGTWQGELFIRSPGQYRFAFEGMGQCQVQIDQTSVLDASSPFKQWHAGSLVDLRAGSHGLKIVYHTPPRTASWRLFWSGPSFAWEPIDPSSLRYDPSDLPDGAGEGIERFERGITLLETLRCNACHQLKGLPAEALAAPDLTRLSGNLRPQWIVDRLMRTRDLQSDDSSMPCFGLSREQSEAIAAYVLNLSSDHRPSPPSQFKRPKGVASQGTAAERGQQLFAQSGCYSCHQIGGLGNNNRYGGGPLDTVADKRPADFFGRMLTDPASVNANHRMPQFAWEPWQAKDLGEFLATLSGKHSENASGSKGNRESENASKSKTGSGSRNGSENESKVKDEGKDERDRQSFAASFTLQQIDAGRQLAQQLGCANCHTMGDQIQSLPSVAIQGNGVDRSADPHRQWGYRLSPSDWQSIHLGLEQSRAEPGPLDGADLLRRNHCLACHRRDHHLGNESIAVELTQKFPAAVAHAAQLVPPSLTSVGDKRTDPSLAAAIAGTAKPRRPWLSVQMPKFGLNEAHAETLTQWLIQQDRMPAEANETAATSKTDGPGKTAQAASGHTFSKTELLAVGPRLVGSSGLGCVSCHAVGPVQPSGAPINARGPDLAGLQKDIRREWFRRWLADPLRIVPRVEMPAIKLPVAGVLDDDLSRQIDALWHTLNLPGFRPPQPDPVRTVRHSGIVASDQAETSSNLRASVLTDVMRSQGQQFIKPLVVGLPNRHNLLFDWQQARLARWWIGDTAMQRTEGKSWYWEAGGANLWDNSTQAASDFQLHVGSMQYDPVRRGQFISELDAWQHLPGGGLQWNYRLHFDVPELQSRQRQSVEPSAKTQNVVLRIQETLTPLPPAADHSAQGFQRRLQVHGLLSDMTLGVRIAPNHFAAGSENTFVDRVDARLRVSASWGDVSSNRGAGPASESGGLNNESISGPWAKVSTGHALVLSYTADLPIDRVPLVPEKPRAAQVKTLHVAPGFTATELGLPSDIMPIAFAWKDAQTMFVADLKGRVFRMRDTDNDRLPDQIHQFSDELAAPFGLSVGDGAVDVITKSALLRLYDDGGDTPCQRIETLASGWGHTADYHDWAMGLPRASDGRYFVSIACQQDERSDAAAKWRGKVIELVPRQPTDDDPQRYQINVLSGGHRFPIGIARNRKGQLFVTDNQGNYNPYNELNHVRTGHRYGFINRSERSADFNPPLTAPAIDIPHPWTRSVNGICFLETPPGHPDASAFGPFEGHLVGCEYDTQRLIRMSLQSVGDTVQGAAYPLTFDRPIQGEPLLGPIGVAVAPDASLMIGNIRDSGWGAGQNTGSLVRMTMDWERLPAGIAEVRATSNGFIIQFTKPVSALKANDRQNYEIQSATRVSTPSYGGDDKNRRREPIESLRYDAQNRRAVIELANDLRTDYVYEFQLAPLIGDEAERFFPDQAFYTLRKIPQ